MCQSSWVCTFKIVVYLLNRTPTKVLCGKSPFEMIYKNPSDFIVLRCFGFQYFLYMRAYTHDKLEDRSVECAFIGHETKQKEYICLSWRMRGSILVNMWCLINFAILSILVLFSSLKKHICHMLILYSMFLLGLHYIIYLLPLYPLIVCAYTYVFTWYIKR